MLLMQGNAAPPEMVNFQNSFRRLQMVDQIMTNTNTEDAESQENLRQNAHLMTNIRGNFKKATSTPHDQERDQAIDMKP